MKTGKYWASIAVDGPKGPALKVKSGIIESARIFGAPIFTVNVAYSSRWTLLKSWDNTIIAKPFCKTIFYFGPGLPTVSKDSDPKDPALLTSLENSMSRNQKIALGKL